MRHLFLCLIVIGFALSGCSRQRQAEPETGFFRDFSLSEIVAQIHAPELKPGSSGYGSSSSPGIRRRREFDFFYAIEEREGTKFDEGAFIMKLRGEAEKAASEAGVRINESGLSGDAFYFVYSDEDHEGWLEVAGTRMEGGRYRLWGVISEITRSGKQ
jgi:hypothetical protein